MFVKFTIKGMTSIHDSAEDFVPNALKEIYYHQRDLRGFTWLEAEYQFTTGKTEYTLTIKDVGEHK